ncbi:protein kinase domain-containing protein [Jiella marina]|uniref:protein kinase domain-containing protein n=1 Tax=Jiella sp. LLJ827 TaxID=2917712 RepID=UPI0021019F47|nr:protein kinase [Jiella sp. LLJ827]MCQ0988634.1 protein kinase [Jiella sp. LLJ827]
MADDPQHGEGDAPEPEGFRAEATRITSPAGAARLAPGVELNDVYVIDGLLAAGGMGEVYRGRNIASGQPVAIKVVLPEFASDQTFMQLFMREANTLSGLTHDAIVRSRDVAVDRRLNRAYFAMEFVEGRSLEKIASERPLSPEEVRRLLMRISAGLEVAHRAGVIHRDLSPDNVILPGDDVDRAKLIDFGIAKSARPGDKTILGKTFAGKFNFVSPEQLGRYHGEVTPKSDIYSLGLLAAAALRGRPIDMTGDSDYARIEKRSVVPEISNLPEPLRGLIAKMLQPDPADRPADMGEIYETLADMGPLTTGLARPGGWQPNSPDARQGGSWPRRPGTETTRDGGSNVVAPPKPRRLWPRVVFVMMLLAVGLGVGIIALWPEWRNATIREFERVAALAGLDSVPTDEPEDTVTVAKRETNDPQPSALSPKESGSREVAARDAGSPGPRPEPVAPSLPMPPKAEPAAQPQSRADAEPRETELAMRQEPAPVPEAVDKTAAFVEFIRSFSAGACFHAVPAHVSDSAVRIEAYGTDGSKAETLLARFVERFSLEPDIEVRPVTAPQCAAVDFAADQRRSEVPPAQVELDQDLIRSGASIEASLKNLGSREVLVLFVDSLGFVQDATQVLDRSADTASLSLFFQMKREAPERQLMMVVSSEKSVATLLPVLPARAPSVFAEFQRMLDKTNIPVSVALQSFRIER